MEFETIKLKVPKTKECHELLPEFVQIPVYDESVPDITRPFTGFARDFGEEAQELLLDPVAYFYALIRSRLEEGQTKEQAAESLTESFSYKGKMFSLAMNTRGRSAKVSVDSGLRILAADQVTLGQICDAIAAKNRVGKH